MTETLITLSTHPLLRRLQKDHRSKKTGPLKPDAICFNTPPTPGPAWWWDGHCYYEYVDDPPTRKSRGQVQSDRHIPTCPPKK
ncbi:unnamed protein product [Leptosia nina]|uniref:Uncharacterized protein n=1 Tax=Leptosia nina TaxID=320188 RepID=A0AAV1IZX3_9NEOP